MHLGQIRFESVSEESNEVNINNENKEEPQSNQDEDKTLINIVFWINCGFLNWFNLKRE